jgi:hypothetical protein
MSKHSSKKSKRRSKAVPALGVTGLSLSLASGAIASTGEATTVGSTTQPHEIFLGEEEVFDTSLSTFFTFDKENGEQTSHAQDLKLAKGGGGGCGGGGGGCGGGGKGGCGGGGGGCGGGYKGGCGGAGAMGVRGPTGAMGVRGPTGAMGVRGPTGAMGVRGWGCKGFQHHCRCAFFRRCFGCGCGGCGGCWGCGTCWIWTPTWGWINTCWSESTPAGEETRVASEQITQTAIAEEKK